MWLDHRNEQKNFFIESWKTFIKLSVCFLFLVVKVLNDKWSNKTGEKSKLLTNRQPPIAQLVERRTVEKLISLGHERIMKNPYQNFGLFFFTSWTRLLDEKWSNNRQRTHPPIAQLVERRTVEKLISLGPWFESGSADDIIYCLIPIAGKCFTFQNWY